MATNYCPQCGEAVSAEDRFCPTCGTTLDPAAGGPVPAERPASKVPIALIALAALGVLLIAGGLFLGGGDDPQPAAELPAVPETARPDEDLPFPNVPRIGLGEAHARQATGEAIFIDVRDTGDYAESHIAGAVSVPLGDTAMDPAYRELPEEAELITYCT